jgi:hypothetical protein
MSLVAWTKQQAAFFLAPMTPVSNLLQTRWSAYGDWVTWTNLLYHVERKTRASRFRAVPGVPPIVVFFQEALGRQDTVVPWLRRTWVWVHTDSASLLRYRVVVSKRGFDLEVPVDASGGDVQGAVRHFQARIEASDVWQNNADDAKAEIALWLSGKKA